MAISPGKLRTQNIFSSGRRVFIAIAFTIAAVARVCAQDGFATINGTCIGGAGGPTVTVTNGTDFNTQINIAGARIIQVQGPISVGKVFTTSNKTIVGLGTNAAILGNLNISTVSNVIVQNLRVYNPGGDGITVRENGTGNPGSRNVWIDHCTFVDCGDGSCDINNGAEFITVSWCKFIYPTQLQHRFTMIADGLAGVSSTNYGEITLHHNWWSTRCDQRMPASSYGRIHMFNNYFTCTNNSYSSNARAGTEMLSENNYYAGVDDPIYADADKDGKIHTSGNIYASCTGMITPGTDTVFTPPYAYTLDATASVPSLISSGAGASGADLVVFPPKIWDGGGANNNLNTALNWMLDETPKAYDVMTFAGSTRLAPNNNYTANTEFSTLRFSNNAGAFVLGGNSLSLGTGIVDDSAEVQNINLNITFAYATDHFGTNRTFDVSAPAGVLVVNAALSGGPNSFFSSYSLTKQGPGLLVLGGINTFTADLKLNGGLLRFNTLDTSFSGSLGFGNVISFDGGGLQWDSGNTADISVRTITIQSGGATLNVGPNNVTFANTIGASSTGALTKTGTGRLTLNGNNNYSGSTTINQGVLALGTAGALPNTPQIILSNNATLDVSGRSDGKLTLASGKTLRGNGSVLGSVTANSGATISPGFSIGALTITNVLTLQPGSTVVMELDANSVTNDTLSGLANVAYGGTLIVSNLNGALAAGQSYKLFDAASYNNSFNSVSLPALAGGLVWTNRLAIDGTIAVISPVSTTPTNITANVDGNALQISWPADHTGWRLEAQTNMLAVGLNSNWFTVEGSAGTNQMFFPIDPANGSVLYRLVYP